MPNLRSLNNINMTDSLTGHEDLNNIIIGIEYGLIAFGGLTAFSAIVCGVYVLNPQCGFQPIMPENFN